MNNGYWLRFQPVNITLYLYSKKWSVENGGTIRVSQIMELKLIGFQIAKSLNHYLTPL